MFGSDLIYSDRIEQHDLLMKTIRMVSNSSTLVVFALHRMHQPERVDVFVNHVLRGSFADVSVVPTAEQLPQCSCDDVVVVVATGLRDAPA